MDIDTYLRCKEINHEEYEIIRFEEYKNIYEGLKKHHFYSMLKYTPRNYCDQTFYQKYIKPLDSI